MVVEGAHRFYQVNYGTVNLVTKKGPSELTLDPDFNFCFNLQILCHLEIQNSCDILPPLRGQFPQAAL